VTGAAAGLDQDLTCSAVLPGVALLLSHRDHEPPCEASEVPDQELVRLTATDRPGQAGSHTADEYSNASDLERPSRASSNARPAPTTFTDRFGASSHRGDQGFKPAQLYSLSGDPSGHGRAGSCGYRDSRRPFYTRNAPQRARIRTSGGSSAASFRNTRATVPCETSSCAASWESGGSLSPLCHSSASRRLSSASTRSLGSS